MREGSHAFRVAAQGPPCCSTLSILLLVVVVIGGVVADSSTSFVQSSRVRGRDDVTFGERDHLEVGTDEVCRRGREREVVERFVRGRCREVNFLKSELIERD